LLNTLKKVFLNLIIGLDYLTTDLVFSPGMKNFMVPYPIFSAISVEKDILSSHHSDWVEITPHYSGISKYNEFIPTDLFGCGVGNIYFNI
jgi:hypothetical protein